MDRAARPDLFRASAATGSVAASARAAGFAPKTAWNRRARLPGFARAMDEAREDADLALEFQLSVEAQNGQGDDYRAGGEPGVDNAQAMRTLTFRENRRRGRHAPNRAKPPDIEAVAEKIERKVRAMKRRRRAEPRDGPPSAGRPTGAGAGAARPDPS